MTEGIIALAGPLVGVIIGSASSLGAQIVWRRTTRQQAEQERSAKMRAERKEDIRAFLDAAQLAERMAKERWADQPRLDSESSAATHSLWLQQKMLRVGSPQLHETSNEFAWRLNHAVWDERFGDDELAAYLGTHRNEFLEAASVELDNLDRE